MEPTFKRVYICRPKEAFKGFLQYGKTHNFDPCVAQLNIMVEHSHYSHQLYSRAFWIEAKKVDIFSYAPL